MRPQIKFLVLILTLLPLGSRGNAATLTGAVKGPDGAPFEGAFVQAQNTKTHMTFSVLSDKQGRYRVEKLPAGEYQVQARTTGYRSEARMGMTLTADQDASLDFALQKAPVPWNELSILQAKKLWPAAKAKDTIFTDCFICHGFQTRMASVTRDAEGWRENGAVFQRHLLGRVMSREAVLRFSLLASPALAAYRSRASAVL